MEGNGGDQTIAGPGGRLRSGRGTERRFPIEGFDFSGTATTTVTRGAPDDVERMLRSVRRQMVEHPFRTLLVAAGIGYLFARMLRRD